MATTCLFLSDRGKCDEKMFRLIRYSMRIWILQEKLRLSLMEARVYTRRERPETLGEIADFFHASTDDLEKCALIVDEKVREALKEDPDFFLGFEPVYPEDDVS